MRELSDTTGIAGTGNMAKALGALMVRCGINVTAVAGRSNASARAAAAYIGAGKAVPLGGLPRYAGRILIAVSDGAISQVAGGLAAAGMRDGIVLHMSGAAGPEALEILRDAGNSVGVIHPLQTIPDADHGLESLDGVTFACAGDPDAALWAEHLISRIGGKSLAVNPAYWAHYHAGAVMACNYQMTLVDAALELMAMAGIGRSAALSALGTILRATTENVLKMGPEKALTGPIRRGDAGTLLSHLNALDQASKPTKDLYIAAALRTIPFAGLDPAAAEKLTNILGSCK